MFYRNQLKMDPITWLKENKRFFSAEMNGHNSVPFNSYLFALPLIDRPGKVIDLGCGNGMFLKFLTLFSGHRLEPFGVDSNYSAVEEAKERVLPAHKKNFCFGDVNEYDFSRGPFDIIIADPFYAKGRFSEFKKACLDNLSSDGRLIFRIYHPSLKDKNLNIDRVLPAAHIPGMRFSRAPGAIFGVFDKAIKRDS